MPDRELSAAFRGKHVLVTGHTGFKGAWLSLWLLKLGARVTGISLPPPTDPSLFDDFGLAGLIDHRIGDIRSPDDFGRAAMGVDADLVIHMAAQSLVRPSFDNPVDTYFTNVVGTAVVLDQVRHMDSARGVVVVSSDKCYENREWPWPYREADALGGADPYSASKGCTELVASSYRRSFFSDPRGCQLASARAGNVFGGGDWAIDRLVPDIVRATIAGSAVTIRNPASVRPWQHVLEPLHGYLMLGAKLLSPQAPDFAESWNFGPSADAFIEVEGLAREFVKGWGPGAAAIAFGKRHDDPHEAGILKLDSSKAHARLGWRPRLSTQEAIALTAQWYRAYAQGSEDLRDLAERQIEAFSNKSRSSFDIQDEVRQCA